MLVIELKKKLTTFQDRHERNLNDELLHNQKSKISSTNENLNLLIEECINAFKS